MQKPPAEVTLGLVSQRRQNAAWQLLASRRAPLIIACLKSLFESRDATIPVDEMEQALAEMLASHANYDEFEVTGNDHAMEARRELRQWIKRRLIIERDGRLIATDDLQQVLRFVDGIQDRIMTSTASRLATVQREIEQLALQLNPDQASRERIIREQIQELERELERVSDGDFEVLEGQAATEAIREIYDLSMSLRADFRRVEDSFRTADKALRQSIISDGHHRGAIVDSLLDTHDELLQTPEGQTFKGFHEQLTREIELNRMKLQLREISRNGLTVKALNDVQRTDLAWLLIRLVGESGGVIRARAASERDVKSFIQTGLASEHHRVGQLLNEVLDAALKVDWSRQDVRRQASALPPIAVDAANLPLVERIRFKALDNEEAEPLSLVATETRLEDFDDEFWAALNTLDRQALFDDTRALLARTGEVMSISELAQHLPPTHDLETMAFWLMLARQAEVPVHDEDIENVNVTTEDNARLRFRVPRVELTSAALQSMDWDT